MVKLYINFHLLMAFLKGESGEEPWFNRLKSFDKMTDLNKNDIIWLGISHSNSGSLPFFFRQKLRRILPTILKTLSTTRT